MRFYPSKTSLAQFDKLAIGCSAIQLLSALLPALEKLSSIHFTPDSFNASCCERATFPPQLQRCLHFYAKHCGPLHQTHITSKAEAIEYSLYALSLYVFSHREWSASSFCVVQAYNHNITGYIPNCSPAMVAGAITFGHNSNW